MKIGGAEADCSFFGQQSELSKDGKKLRIEFDAKGAKLTEGTVPVTGEIAVVTASEKGTAESGLVEWKKGAESQFKRFEIGQVVSLRSRRFDKRGSEPPPLNFPVG